MKFTTIFGLTLTLLTTSISAHPFFETWSDSVTIQLSNDWSGAHAEAKISADGKKHSIKSLFDGSALQSEDGNILATSAQLTKFDKNTVCRIVEPTTPVRTTLTASDTWAFLDRGAWVNLDRGSLWCFES
ncbi:hypothetical protein ETB97_007487 [Aspergillus alliaceus]|uniref:Uncharacterized protein n=1 Tax=Petromyces alliaceus TaxID=209559 RepID=A0A5N6FVN5_PETAA|nr:uncharacterized protein BDW43DRAFT_311353 [Aspergillus alliaceus]KAB8233275.1 hypothetical protein BDW43DRAFT_311353 [Aspergillus alliaceus]KAF5856355.1 hypothetical protein ETB97_007487 [Aspergillus burnettii]